jgi:hypothetical protein
MKHDERGVRKMYRDSPRSDAVWFENCELDQWDAYRMSVYANDVLQKRQST